MKIPIVIINCLLATASCTGCSSTLTSTITETSYVVPYSRNTTKSSSHSTLIRSSHSTPNPVIEVSTITIPVSITKTTVNGSEVVHPIYSTKLVTVTHVASEVAHPFFSIKTVTEHCSLCSEAPKSPETTTKIEGHWPFSKTTTSTSTSLVTHGTQTFTKKIIVVVEDSTHHVTSGTATETASEIVFSCTMKPSTPNSHWITSGNEVIHPMTTVTSTATELRHVCPCPQFSSGTYREDELPGTQEVTGTASSSITANLTSAGPDEGGLVKTFVMKSITRTTLATTLTMSQEYFITKTVSLKY